MKTRLKYLRKLLNLKQKDIARKLGVDTSTVGSWECGRDPIPKTRVYQLCKEYNINPNWLNTGEGDIFEQPRLDIKPETVFVSAALALYKELSPHGKMIFFQSCETLVKTIETQNLNSKKGNNHDDDGQ